MLLLAVVMELLCGLAAVVLQRRARNDLLAMRDNQELPIVAVVELIGRSADKFRYSSGLWAIYSLSAAVAVLVYAINDRWGFAALHAAAGVLAWRWYLQASDLAYELRTIERSVPARWRE